MRKFCQNETRLRHVIAAMAMAVVLMTALSTGPAAALEGAPQVKSGYAPVNGLRMYTRSTAAGSPITTGPSPLRCIIHRMAY